MTPLILASTSPRRKELFPLLQLPFETVEPDFAEQVRSGADPAQQAKEFARGKAQSCARRFPDRLVLGSDTLIAVGRDILGKPADRAEARAMLQRLQGRDHVIYTAVALCGVRGGIHDVVEETVQVWMKPLSEGAIEAYLATGEWVGKAGAYAIQGAGGDLIERIEGDYTAAVGLPLRCVARLLARHGVTLPVDVERLYQAKPYPNWDKFQR